MSAGCIYSCCAHLPFVASQVLLLLLFIFFQSALKMHLLLYSAFLIFQAVRPHDGVLHLQTLLYMLPSAFSVVFAERSLVWKFPPGLIPFLILAVAEACRFSLCSVAMMATSEQFHSFASRWFLIIPKSQQDFLLASLYGVGGAYFLCVAANVLTVSLDLKNSEIMIYEEISWLERQFCLVGQDSFVERNADSPPTYSTIVGNAPDSVHTAKETTPPPRYTHLERLQRWRQSASKERLQEVVAHPRKLFCQ